MKTNIKYSIYSFIFSIIFFSASSLGLFMMIADKSLFSIFYGILFAISLLMLIESLQNIQWIDIKNGYITVHSLLGIIKRIELIQIKKAFKTNVEIFGIKALSIKRKHIVLCLNKTVKASDVTNAYNRKKNKYIIIMNTKEIENKLSAEYQKYCNSELMIK